jgi:hypothetical protein
MGLGRNSVSSRNRVPSPPQKITTFIDGGLISESPAQSRVAIPSPTGTAGDLTKKPLAGLRSLRNDLLVHPQPHRRGRRLRRFFRNNPQVLFVVFILVLVVALVAGLFWLITSPDFVKPR